MRSVTVIFISFALLVAQIGCATLPVSPPPLSEEARAKLGTIGIVSATFIPESNLFAFAKGSIEGAAKGLAAGTTVAAVSGAILGALAGTELLTIALTAAPVIGPALLIIGGAIAITGAAVGILATTPAEKVKEIEMALAAALTELRIQETMRRHLFRVASDQTYYQFVLIDEQGPTTKDQEVNYSFLRDKGIDTILEVSVLRINFEGEGRKDPLLGLFMTVRVRLIRLSDCSILYTNEFGYKSAKRKFSIWLQNNAQPFTEELERAYQSLSEKIVEDLFLLYDFPLDPTPLIDRIRERMR